MFTKADIVAAAKRLGVNFKVVSLNTLMYGLHVELEHRDVTKGKLIPTLKIVLAHLKEFPDYYVRLRRMEAAADKHWKTKKKPKIVTTTHKKK